MSVRGISFDDFLLNEKPHEKLLSMTFHKKLFWVQNHCLFS